MINSIEQKLVTEARRHLGTPWIHQGRCPGVGLDCIGLVVCSLAKVGIKIEDIRDYPKSPEGNNLLMEEMNRQLVRIENNGLFVGAICLFGLVGVYHHVGIVTDWNGGFGLIHIHQMHGKCIEHSFDQRWLRRLLSVYKCPVE